MDIRGAVAVEDPSHEDEDEFQMRRNVQDNFQSRRNENILQQRRSNFRSETFAYSSDRTTIEDMADHVISRVIDTAAICVQNSLGFTFLHQSKDLLPEEGEEELASEASQISNNPKEELSEANEDEDTFTGTEGMTFPVARRQHLAAHRKLSRNSSLTGNQPPITLQECDYPLADGFNNTLGSEFIEKIIETWELSPEAWNFRVEFLRIQPSPNQSQYMYNVIFTPTNPSLRTKRKIQVTAQIEFTITVNHLLDSGQESRVVVEFRLEGQRFRHAPGQFRFREFWLQNIVDKKQKLIRQITL